MSAPAKAVKRPGELRPGDVIVALDVHLPGATDAEHHVFFHAPVTVHRCWPRRSPLTNARCWLVYREPDGLQALTLYPQDRATVQVPAEAGG